MRTAHRACFPVQLLHLQWNCYQKPLQVAGHRNQAFGVWREQKEGVEMDVHRNGDDDDDNHHVGQSAG